MEASAKKLLPLTLFAIAATSLFSVQPAQAYTVTLEQVGSNVVATGTGAIDLTGLNQGGPGSFSSQMNPSFPYIYTGTNGAPIVGYSTFSFTGVPNFGSGGLNPANSSFGDFVGIAQVTINPFFHFLAFDLPGNYSSNDPLSSSATWNNATFNSLGVTPGTYEWTWGTGTGNENFTLIIEAAGVPDSGSTVCLLGFALAGLGMLRRKLSC